MKWTRRQWIQTVAWAAAPASALSALRLAICSETFAGMKFGDACKAARQIGFTGIEVAPSHLADDPAALSSQERRAFRSTIGSSGLVYVGTHALMSAPKGLHLTTPNAEVRHKSWDYFRRLIDLSADLGDRPVMVLGSSKQRQAVDGTTVEDATKRLEEGLAELAPAAAARNVTILLEPLAKHLCNVINTLEQATAIVKRVDSPALQSMFDTHNTTEETLPYKRLIEKYLPFIRHVHLNELDGRHPGTGHFPFGEVVRAFKRLGYKGWLSVEVFDFKPDGETVARESFAYLRRLERQI